MKYLTFISAGGKGSRLWEVLPTLKTENLPKSLGILVNNKPLIYYQLKALTKIPNNKIVICFSDKKSIVIFKKLIVEHYFPKGDYLITSNLYHPDNTAIDVIRSSRDKSFLRESFDRIIISSGDVYFEGLEKVIKSENRNLLNIYKFHKMGSSLRTNVHLHFSNRGELKYLQTSQKYPKEVIGHPMILSEDTFDIYLQLPPRSSKYELINYSLLKGHKFYKVKLKNYFNVNYPKELLKLKSVIGK